MAGSLSVATTAISSANVAVVDSGEVGRSVVYAMYNNGPRKLTTFRYVRVDWGKFHVLSFNLCEELSPMQIGF
jgi:hypothetical protein